MSELEPITEQELNNISFWVMSQPKEPVMRDGECSHQYSTGVSPQINGRLMRQCDSCGLLWVVDADSCFSMPAAAFLTPEELEKLDFQYDRLATVSNYGS